MKFVFLQWHWRSKREIGAVLVKQDYMVPAAFDGQRQPPEGLLGTVSQSLNMILPNLVGAEAVFKAELSRRLNVRFMAQNRTLRASPRLAIPPSLPQESLKKAIRTFLLRDPQGRIGQEGLVS